jgi:hypothetical protein
MGNHEYCELCGENNFHYDEPCDPDKKAKHQAAKDARIERQIRAERAAKAMINTLYLKGIPATLDFEYKYVITISGFDLIDTPHEPTH